MDLDARSEQWPTRTFLYDEWDRLVEYVNGNMTQYTYDAPGSSESES